MRRGRFLLHRILLPALNSQDDDKSYDMRYALRDIVEKYEIKIQKESLSSSANKNQQKVQKKNTEIRVEDITNFKVLSASKALLVAYKEWGGKHYFAVHPKGNGVVVHPKLTEGIPRGTYVNSYVESCTHLGYGREKKPRPKRSDGKR